MSRAHAASARPASRFGPGCRCPRCTARARSGSEHPLGEAVTGRGRTWLILNVVSVGRKVAALGAGFHPVPRPEADAPPLDSAKRWALGTHPFSLGLQRL